MVSDKERLEEALRWLKEVKRLKQDKERLYSNSFLQGYKQYIIPHKYHDMEGVSEDEVDKIIQRYERDLEDLETGNFQK
ncbi:hypothetical protein [Haloquadratum walsbyi]|uniref:Uncharacterized protein n=1 Tax=Haloquadratum walsbyi (strain DSM 16854 / JCM 12705 / C23) TaxID=768065 RepID=G0LJP2_HALWC|nr:hypothetical protein [Haloquadratum walsbyi]CCC40976.1 uncharacterized protein Hqrw_3195 [Haloquadratum walsbyi C23]